MENVWYLIVFAVVMAIGLCFPGKKAAAPAKNGKK